MALTMFQKNIGNLMNPDTIPGKTNTLLSTCNIQIKNSILRELNPLRVFILAMVGKNLPHFFNEQELLYIFLNGPSSDSFSFIFVFSNKHYNSYNKYM